MRIQPHQPQRGAGLQAAFTLVETLFAMALGMVMFLALYSALAMGFSLIKMARENTRATQILVEKMETIRLYTWDQLNSNGFVVTNFTVPYYPMDPANPGVIYTGMITVANVPFSTSYAADMKKVRVGLKWSTGKMPRSRTASTYVSRYGLQNYIY